MAGLVNLFIPFGQTMDIIYALGACLIFSGYIVYDTFMITKRLSPDEFILGSISLYLEYVLFHPAWKLTNCPYFIVSLTFVSSTQRFRRPPNSYLCF